MTSHEFRIVSDFKPTWLVRVSDMQAVPGLSVNGHYWALSYSWNQSGELIHKGGENYDRIDEGRHQIIEYPEDQEYTFQKFGTRSLRQFNNIDPKTASTVYVKFERLIQQICKDFDVEYIWFDQICINQGDHDAKMKEIKQMHNIYKNARCTIALIPEFRWIRRRGTMGPDLKVIPTSQWCQRIWTLEEAYVTKNIVFLGSNVHLWGNVNLIWSLGASVIKTPNDELKKWWASTALWYARNRTSSKAHDRIFAMANIFPEVMDGISFNYKQPLLELMVRFYRALAQRDKSILLFGALDDSDPKDQIAAVRRREASLLPSWTGASGAHISHYDLRTYFEIMTPRYTISGDSMRLTSSFVVARIEDPSAVEKPDGFDDPERNRPVKATMGADGKIIIPEIKRCTLTGDGLPGTAFKFESVVQLLTGGSSELIFVTATSESQVTLAKSRRFGLKMTHILPLAVKENVPINTLTRPEYYGGFLSLTEECSECRILFEPSFVGDWQYIIYPVVKKDKGCYKSIGVCVIDTHLSYDSIIQRKQIFHIK
ncbi:hypothetical protein BJV82DRAFT_669221 [Fennellomyces sp. T-0311]|nr:hypothetical protein BJV82DRAFT_669221 [Fennellomyces sp. T-0311]